MSPVLRSFLAAIVVARLAPIGSAPGAIRNDVPDSLHLQLAAQPQFAPVGRISIAGDPKASGVLIAPDWLVTDAHVVTEGSTERQGSKRLPASTLSVQLGGRSIAVREVIVHPEYFGPSFSGATDLLTKKGLDVALIRLAETVQGIEPARLYRGTNEVGRLAALVGFGTSGTSSTAITAPGPVGVKRAGTNVIDQVGGKVGSRTIPPHYLVTDFDSPVRSLSQTGDSVPVALEYLPLGGDSGGGLFIEDAGVWYLAGLFATSTIKINTDMTRDGLYGTVSYATRVNAIADWLSSIIGAGQLTR